MIISEQVKQLMGEVVSDKPSQQIAIIKTGIMQATLTALAFHIDTLCINYCGSKEHLFIRSCKTPFQVDDRTELYMKIPYRQLPGQGPANRVYANDQYIWGHNFVVGYNTFMAMRNRMPVNPVLLAQLEQLTPPIVTAPAQLELPPVQPPIVTAPIPEVTQEIEAVYIPSQLFEDFLRDQAYVLHQAPPNPALDLLAIHNRIMGEYDVALHNAMTEFSGQPNQHTFKHAIDQLLDITLPKIYKSSPSVMQACMEAYKATSAALTEIKICQFREYFSANLLNRLYCNNLFCGNNLKILSNRFVAKHFNDPTNLQELVTTLYDDIHSSINSELNHFQKHLKSLGRQDQALVSNLREEIQVLQNKFKKTVTDFIENPAHSISMQFNAIQHAALDYQVNGKRLVRKYQLKTQSDLSWKPFLHNLALGLTVIGIFPLLMSLAWKLIKGRYLFFDPLTLQPTPYHEMRMEDKVITRLRI